MKKVFKSKKRFFVSVVAVAMAIFVVANVCASAFFSLALFKRDGWSRFEKYFYGEELKTESEWIEENSKEIQIDNSENKKLTGLEIKNEHVSHSYVIICHQYGGSPQSMEAYAKHFYDLGFNILLPYMRGHGASSHNNVSFGWGDSVDIADWVDNIISEDKKARIALFGVSLGANAVTLCASGELPENVRFVIADSCYTSMDALVKEFVKRETIFSSFVTVNILSALAKNKLGERLKDANTIAELENIELPIMFINGENDTVVPPLLSKKLYENCDAYGVEEVIIEKGVHGRNLAADEQAYWSHVDIFVLNNLGL